jgi:hypothetical protein
MDSTVIAAIIGAGGAIVVAVVTAFAPELKILLAGKARTNSDLIGKWNCTWHVRRESGENNTINDVVKISKVWGENLWAPGVNTVSGDYKITGRVSRSYLVTLHYEGDGRRQPLGGVVILKLNSTRDSMNGYWYQYGLEERIVGGSTTWTKAH